jgi:small subunit ribosomal protein S17
MNILKKKILEGIVVSNSMDKTIVVKVIRVVKHTKYGKFIKRSTKYFVHDENNECYVGDIVFFKEVAPISKKKNFIFCSFKKKLEGIK